MRNENVEILLSVLPHGEQNAASTDSLLCVLGLADSRSLRKLVARARLDGAVICSCENGYFLPENRSEIEKFYKTTRAKALSTLTILRSARVALSATDGQLEIDEVIFDGKS